MYSKIGDFLQRKWLRWLAHSAQVAERSYPTSEVRGSSRECQAAVAQEWPRRATPSRGQGGMSRRSHPVSKVRGNGLEEPPGVQSQGRQPGRSTHVQGALAALVQEGLEELSLVEGQEGCW